MSPIKFNYMKTKLFPDEEDLQAIANSLEAENCGIEELHDFLRPFEDEEQAEIEADFMTKSKELNTLEKQLEAVSSPLKEQMKPVKKEVKVLIDNIQRGGIIVTEKVYCFPDIDSKMMGLYDSKGTLVGTRPMKRSEKQLHINSHNKRAVGE